MPMLNLLRRQQTDTPKPTLRERIAATKGRAGRAAAAARIILKKPKSEPAPAPRDALITYATWLAVERRLVCRELYPHVGSKADSFISDAPGATAFHCPPGRSWQDVPLPSSRAVQLLDMLGVQWRSEREVDRPYDLGEAHDREPAPLPYGWPQTDAEILTALVDLRRLDIAIESLLAHLPVGRDVDLLPGYSDLQEARRSVLDVLQERRALSLAGLQAKAKVLLVETVLDDDETFRAIAHSLVRDLTCAPPWATEPTPDPILPVIEEGRRLLAVCRAEYAIPDPGTEPRQERLDAHSATFAHWRGPLRQTVPTSARGCTELARYVSEFQAIHELADEDDLLPLFASIARSPVF